MLESIFSSLWNLVAPWVFAVMASRDRIRLSWTVGRNYKPNVQTMSHVSTHLHILTLVGLIPRPGTILQTGNSQFCPAQVVFEVDGIPDFLEPPEALPAPAPAPSLLCGNGIKEIGELCDDGNLANGDGCTAECIIEKDFLCIFDGNPLVDGEKGLAAIQYQSPAEAVSHILGFEILIDQPASSLVVSPSTSKLLNNPLGFAMQLFFETGEDLFGFQTLIGQGSTCGGFFVGINFGKLLIGSKPCNSAVQFISLAGFYFSTSTTYLLDIQMITNTLSIVHINGTTYPLPPLATVFTNDEAFVVGASDYGGNDVFQGTVDNFLLFEVFDVIDEGGANGEGLNECKQGLPQLGCASWQLVISPDGSTTQSMWELSLGDEGTIAVGEGVEGQLGPNAAYLLCNSGEYVLTFLNTGCDTGICCADLDGDVFYSMFLDSALLFQGDDFCDGSVEFTFDTPEKEILPMPIAPTPAPTPTPSPTPSPIIPQPTKPGCLPEGGSSISVGNLPFAHTCGVRFLPQGLVPNELECFGDDTFGQSSPPLGVSFRSVAAGGAHTCGVIQSNGIVLCFGDNTFGQATAPLNLPLSFVDAGQHHTCGIRVDDANAVCWGSNEFGQLDSPNGVKFASLSAGVNHNCGLGLNGIPYCWGDNSFGQAEPIQLPEYVSIGSGTFHTCAVFSNGTATCFGDPAFGRTNPPSKFKFTSVVSGLFHSCALEYSTGKPICWGSGEAADPSSVGAQDISFDFLAAQGEVTCGVASIAGVLICWGTSDTGAHEPPPLSLLKECDPAPAPAPSPFPSPQPIPEPIPIPFPSPNPAAPTPAPQASPTPTPSPEPTPSPSPEATPAPVPRPSPGPAPTPSPAPLLPPLAIGEGLYSIFVKDAGPEAYWRLDEVDGSFPFGPIDCVGDNNGLYSGDVVTNVPPGAVNDGNPAITLDGKTGFAAIPYRSILNQPSFTVEAWVLIPGGVSFTGRQPIVSSLNSLASAGLAGGSGFVLAIGFSGGNTIDFQITVFARNLKDGTQPSVTLTTPAPEGIILSNYNYVVASLDGQEQILRLYVNGKLEAVLDLLNHPLGPFVYIPNADSALGLPLLIGKSPTLIPPGDSIYLQGSIDEVAIYSFRLPDLRIQTHFFVAQNIPAPTPQPAPVTPSPAPSPVPTPTPVPVPLPMPRPIPVPLPAPQPAPTPAPMEGEYSDLVLESQPIAFWRLSDAFGLAINEAQECCLAGEYLGEAEREVVPGAVFGTDSCVRLRNPRVVPLDEQSFLVGSETILGRRLMGTTLSQNSINAVLDVKQALSEIPEFTSPPPMELSPQYVSVPSDEALYPVSFTAEAWAFIEGSQLDLFSRQPLVSNLNMGGSQPGGFLLSSAPPQTEELIQYGSFGNVSVVQAHVWELQIFTTCFPIGQPIFYDTVYLQASGPLNLYRWTHVVGSYQASKRLLRLHVDGSLQAEAQLPADCFYNPVGGLEADAPLEIGAGSAITALDSVFSYALLPENAFPAFNGLLDEVAYYGYALASSLIGKHFSLAAKNLIPQTQVPIYEDILYPSWMDASWPSIGEYYNFTSTPALLDDFAVEADIPAWGGLSFKTSVPFGGYEPPFNNLNAARISG
eukprot:scaffold1540_cov359-Prasinococcus_capsulatus_cf.AAC.1